MNLSTPFTRQVGIEIPLICGAMYPCSNPELVAAVSKAGGIGIIQPLSMVYVHRHSMREGMKIIRSITDKPVGFNLIVEKSSKKYEDRMKEWLDVALEEGVRFFITALGNPRWVVEKVRPLGGIVYHDVTAKKWAQKALESDVDGLICVNNRAGGHAGTLNPQQLIEELSSLGKPLICAGGIGSGADFAAALKMGYAGVQLGTRFIASTECSAHNDYKQAIVRAKESDIVLTDKISGVPVSIIKTPYIEKIGTRAGFFARFLLRNAKTKHYMRMFYTLQSIWKLKKASMQGAGYKDYWQAGKSVAGIDKIESVAEIVGEFAQEARKV